MRHMLLLCVMALLAVTAVQAEPLAFVDEWAARGQPAYGQNRAVLSATRPAALKAEPSYPEGAVRYGVFTILSPEGQASNLVAALVGDLAKPVALFVDADRDGILTEQEQATSLAQAASPPGFGKPGEALWSATIFTPSPRVLALRISPIGCMLTAAMRGFYQGQVPAGDKQIALAVIDADADLWLKPGRDFAYLDLNADGKFDPATEKFLDLGALETGDIAVRVAPAMSVTSAQWTTLPKGQAGVTFTLGPLAKTPAALMVSLTRDKRQSLMIKVLGEPTTLQAGSYTIESILAKAEAPDGSVRSYTFERNGEESFQVAPDKPLTVDLLGKVSVNVGTTGEPAPGETVNLEVAAVTSTGLRMTACANGELSAQQQGLVAPVIEFRAPDGTVLDSGPMEFG